MVDDTERLRIHFKYCVLILVMMLIAVATDRWTAQKDFTTYLSNAATLTSLVLGLVAIFYSFVSNDSLSRSLGSISTVSAEIEEARDQISQFVSLTNKSLETEANNAMALQDASKSVGTSLTSLQETLAALSEQNTALSIILVNLPGRIDQLELTVVDVAKALGEKPQQPTSPVTSNDISDNAVDRFLARPSLSYNLLTYATVLAAQTKKPLSIDAICEAVSLEQPSTMTGFVNAMNAVQLLSRDGVKGQTRVYTVTSVHPRLVAKTKEYITSYIKRSYVAEIVEQENWTKKMEAVEALFL